MSPIAFGHYTVIRPLGSGGMADVYLARDPVLNRQVAIKAPRAEFFSAEGRARFTREARAAAGLEHFAIVPIYDYSEQDGLPYMVMRLLNGGSLEDRIARRPFSPAEALPILERIATALDYAHARGVIHRDVKSANILFDDAGAAYLSDFGIAWMASEATKLTATGTVRGTFDYISPEQARGEPNLDGRADLYSLGIVLFEMLAGDVPYKADSGMLVAVQHISAPIPDIRARRPDLPPALQNVIVRALAKRREDRYPTGAALAADLRRALAGQRVVTPRPPRAATPRPTTPPGRPDAGRRNWLLAVVALAVLGIPLFILLGDGETGGNGATPTAEVVPTEEIVAEKSAATPEPTSTTAAIAPEPTTPPLPTSNSIPDEIVFQSNRDGDFEIYIMESSGGEARQLTFNNADDNYPRVSADGQHIVFVSQRDGNEEIYSMNRDGSGQTRLTADASRDNLPAWSPDGDEIVFVSSRDGLMDVFIMDADGGDVRQITDSLEREGRTSWSPDGGRLAYNASLENYWQVYVSDADGANRQKITDSTYDEWSPEWSPDGEWLLFNSERDSRANPGIYLMRPDGSDVRLIYNGDGEEWGASWSADGTRIVFAANRPDDSDDLMIMGADGGDLRLLMEGGSFPSWAVGQPGSAGEAIPAGGEITVSGTVARTPTGLTLTAGQPVVIEVIGGGWRAGAGAAWPEVGGGGDPQVAAKATFPVPDRPIMTLVGGVGDGAPFAVGERLVFTAGEDGELWLGPNDDNPADNDGELLVRVTVEGAEGGSRTQTISLAAEPFPLSGDGLVRLTFGGRAHYTATFAPDQSRILMSVEMDDGWHVFEADPNGGGLGRQFTHGPNDHYQADFSPDGRTFLTSANLDGDGDIYLFDATTGERLQQVTNNRGMDYHPRWLPDGQSFIFSLQVGDTDSSEIFLGTLDGQQTQLTRNDTFDGFATPSADGDYITFYAGRDGDYEIYIMDTDGGNPRRLTTSAGRDASPSFSPDGRWIVFESERDGGYEIYAVPLEGGETTRLTDSDGDNYFPVISPDGRWLMFQSDREGTMDIYRQPWVSP